MHPISKDWRPFLILSRRSHIDKENNESIDESLEEVTDCQRQGDCSCKLKLDWRTANAAIHTFINGSNCHLNLFRIHLSQHKLHLPLHESFAGYLFRVGNRAFEHESNKAFRDAIKTIDVDTTLTTSETSFYTGFLHRTLHKSKQTHYLNNTGKEELFLIQSALTSESISLRAHIAQLVDRDPSGDAFGDSNLDGAGGWSPSCKFWRHLDWSDAIRQATLRFHSKHIDSKLISINVLEFASVITNYAAMSMSLYFRLHPDPSNPYPGALLWADNVSAEIWAMKGCKRSLLGRALGRILCALMGCGRLVDGSMRSMLHIDIAHLNSRFSAP